MYYDIDDFASDVLFNLMDKHELEKEYEKEIEEKNLFNILLIKKEGF